MVDSATYSGSVPDYYDRCLGPAWFDAFASDSGATASPQPVRRRAGDRLRYRPCDPAAARAPRPERSAGRHGLEQVDAGLRARQAPRLPAHRWREADAMNLPFADGEFAAVVCAFGFMFVPDKSAAFREAARVLKAGGILFFDVWDRIEENPHNATVRTSSKACSRAMKKCASGFPTKCTTPRCYGGFSRRRALTSSTSRRNAFRSIASAREPLPPARFVARRGRSSSRSEGRRSTKWWRNSPRRSRGVGGADPYRGFAQAVMVEARRRA